MASLFEQLRERKLVRWLLAYAAGAWVAVEVVDVVGQWWQWEVVWVRAVQVVLALGLVFTVVLAWYHGERGRQRVSGPELIVIALLAIIATAVLRVTVPRRDAMVPDRMSPIEDIGTSAIPATTAPSIAVLAFEDRSAAGDQEHFSDGLSEAIHNKLYRIRALRVASLTSSFAFKDKSESAMDIGRALGVLTVLEGGLRTDGDSILLSVSLIDVESGFVRWGQTFNRQLEGVFAVQDEIALAVANDLQVELGAAAALPTPTTVPVNYDNYLRARRLLNRRELDGIKKAQDYLEGVVAVDPDYAPAQATLAKAMLLRVQYGPAEATPELRAAYMQQAERALALNPSSSEAVLARALGFIYEDYRWDDALSLLNDAISREPGLADLYHGRATVTLALGRFGEARADWARATELDPASLPYSHNTVYPLNYCLEGEASLAQATLTQELFPQSGFGSFAKGLSYLVLDDFGPAVDALSQALEVRWIDHVGGYLGFAHAKANNREQAFTLLRRFDGSQGPASHHAAALVATGLGDSDRALDHLEQAYATRIHQMTEVAVRPAFISLRTEPRFQALLELMGLEDVVSPNSTCRR